MISEPTGVESSYEMPDVCYAKIKSGDEYGIVSGVLSRVERAFAQRTATNGGTLITKSVCYLPEDKVCWMHIMIH